MKRLKVSVFLIALALLAGAAIGYCLAPGADGASRPAEERPVRPKGRIRDNGESAVVRSLRGRIAELERMLAERRYESAPTNAPVVAATPPQRPRPGEWLRNLEKNDPKRYVQMTNRFERMRRNRYERMCRDLDFLSSVDVSNMSAKARETHAELQEAILVQDELSERLRELHNNPEATEEDRQAIFREMRENGRQLDRLRREERVYLFEETAKNLGFKGDEANDIVQTLKDIVDSTEGEFGRHHRHGRR